MINLPWAMSTQIYHTMKMLLLSQGRASQPRQQISFPFWWSNFWYSQCISHRRILKLQGLILIGFIRLIFAILVKFMAIRLSFHVFLYHRFCVGQLLNAKISKASLKQEQHKVLCGGNWNMNNYSHWKRISNMPHAIKHYKLQYLQYRETSFGIIGHKAR